ITMLLDVTEVGAAVPVVFTMSRSLAGVVSNPEPLMVTEPPGATIWGVNEVMLGFPGELVTVKELVLVPVPAGAVTEIVPVVAPVGTVTTSCVVEALLIVAVVPLNFTVSLLAGGAQVFPLILTCAAPSPGPCPSTPH